MEVHVEPEGAVSSLHCGDGAGVGVGNAWGRTRRHSRLAPRGRGHSRATHASPRARSKSSDARVRGATRAAPCGQRCRPFGDRGRRGKIHGVCRRQLRVANGRSCGKRGAGNLRIRARSANTPRTHAPRTSEGRHARRGLPAPRGSSKRPSAEMSRSVMSATSWPTSLPSGPTPISTLPPSQFRNAQSGSPAHFSSAVERLSSSVSDSPRATSDWRAARVVTAGAAPGQVGRAPSRSCSNAPSEWDRRRTQQTAAGSSALDGHR